MSTTLNYLNKAIGNYNLLLDERKNSWDLKVLPFIKKMPIWGKISKTLSTKMHNKIPTPFIKVPRQTFYTPQIKKPKQNIEFNEGIIMQNIEFRLLDFILNSHTCEPEIGKGYPFQNFHFQK